jgi:hypothetical protein
MVWFIKSLGNLQPVTANGNQPALQKASQRCPTISGSNQQKGHKEEGSYGIY